MTDSKTTPFGGPPCERCGTVDHPRMPETIWDDADAACGWRREDGEDDRGRAVPSGLTRVEGAEAEQQETLAFLEAIPERTIQNWGLNAVAELIDLCRAGAFGKGERYWKESK